MGEGGGGGGFGKHLFRMYLFPGFSSSLIMMILFLCEVKAKHIFIELEVDCLLKGMLNAGLRIQHCCLKSL